MDDTTLARLSAAADRVELTELLHRFHQAIDVDDWDAFADLFTEDACIEFISLNDYRIFGLEGRHEGRQVIIDWVKAGVAPFNWNGAPARFMTNHSFELDGDTATSKTFLVEVDLVSGLVICSGIYDAQHIRTADGWRIKAYHLGMWITDGARASLESQRADTLT